MRVLVYAHIAMVMANWFNFPSVKNVIQAVGSALEKDLLNALSAMKKHTSSQILAALQRVPVLKIVRIPCMGPKQTRDAIVFIIINMLELLTHC